MSSGLAAFAPIVVVPVFNEAETIGEVVAAARAHAPVLVVDDGSDDGSAADARAAGAEVLPHPRRLGKGQAILTGVAAAPSRRGHAGSDAPARSATVRRSARPSGAAAWRAGRASRPRPGGRS